MNEKQCSKCKRVQPLSEFAPDKRMKLGVGSQCKACNRERMKGYMATHKEQTSERNRIYREQHKGELNRRANEYHAENRDKLNEKRRAKYKANPEKFIADQVRYRAQHREYINARQRAYYAAHPEEDRARNYQWRKKNPEKHKAHLKKRRALKAGAKEATLTAEQWQAIQVAYDFRCAYCGCKPKNLTQDHVEPLRDGGPHTQANVVPACTRCNCKKWANRNMAPCTPEEIRGEDLR